MKKCPSCGYTRAYELSDGRSKFKRCGQRYRWRSAWSASRLSDVTKYELLRRFVWGVPVYRQLLWQPRLRVGDRAFLSPGACLYGVGGRTARAVRRRARMQRKHVWRGSARQARLGRCGKVIVFGIIKRNGQVKALPIAAHSRGEVMRHIQAHTREGALYHTDEWQAYATLRMRGEHVVIR